MKSMTSKRTVIEAALAALITSALSLVVFGPILKWFASGWAGGDMLSTYVNAEVWSGFAYRTTTHFGFPLGMNLNYFPGIDITENTFAQIVTNLTGHPFIGINLLVFLSFPLVAVLAYLTIRLTGLRGPLAIALAVAFAVIPFHWGRALGHTYLSTLYSLVIGVALALLIGSGAFEYFRTSPNKRVRIWFIVSVVVMMIVIAWTGIYYAVFSLILISAAVLWRIAKRAGIRSLIWEISPLIGIGILCIIGFIPALLTLRGDAPLASLGDRTPFESVLFAGNLAMALLPLPQSVLPGMAHYNTTVTSAFGMAPTLENNVITNHGTWVTAASLIAFLLAVLVRSRRSAGQPSSSTFQFPVPSRPRHAPRVSLGLIGYLLVVALLFFIPWGLNFFFAELVTPQIRAWNRLLPALLLLFILGGAVGVQRTRIARSLVVALPVSLIILGLVAVDSVRPFKEPYLTSASQSNAINKAAQEYAVDVNAAIPENCGVLQLPYMAYPENGPVNRLNDYDHFWTSLANPEKSWSYGAVKNTDASVWAAQLPNVPSDSQLALMRAGGFCAIHLDTRGLDAPSTEATTTDLQSRLGAPVATGFKGKWLLYSLAQTPSTAGAPNEAEVDDFFHQPFVTADPETFSPRESALTNSWWWATAPEASLVIEPTSAESAMSRISGSLGATSCGTAIATIAATANGESVTANVQADPGAPTPFELLFPKDTANAVTVTVSTSSPSCATNSAKAQFAQLLNLNAQ